MADEGLPRKADSYNRDRQSRRGHGNKRDLAIAAVLAEVLLVLAPAASEAQSKPSLVSQIIQKQQEVAVAIQGLAGYTYTDPNVTARFITKHCISGYTDYFRRATTKRTGPRTISAKLTGSEGVAPGAVARRSFVTSVPGPETSFGFNCNVPGEDVVRARVMTRISKKGKWRAYGNFTIMTPSARRYDVQAVGDPDPPFVERGKLKARGTLRDSKLRKGRYGFQVKNTTATPEGTATTTRTTAIKRQNQTTAMSR